MEQLLGPDGPAPPPPVAAVSLRGHYVQVRYPQGQWVTLAIEGSRPAAVAVAAREFPGLLNARGDTPRQCRVVSAAQLVREGGEGALRAVAAEIARRGDTKASRSGRARPSLPA
jgi:hypothetical protein